MNIKEKIKYNYHLTWWTFIFDIFLIICVESIVISLTGSSNPIDWFHYLKNHFDWSLGSNLVWVKVMLVVSLLFILASFISKVNLIVNSISILKGSEKVLDEGAKIIAKNSGKAGLAYAFLFWISILGFILFITSASFGVRYKRINFNIPKQLQSSS